MTRAAGERVGDGKSTRICSRAFAVGNRLTMTRSKPYFCVSPARLSARRRTKPREIQDQSAPHVPGLMPEKYSAEHCTRARVVRELATAFKGPVTAWKEPPRVTWNCTFCTYVRRTLAIQRLTPIGVDNPFIRASFCHRYAQKKRYCA